MRAQSLSREDPLEEEMVTHSSILAWGMSGTGVCPEAVPRGTPSQLQERTMEASRPVFSWALPPASPQAAFNLCPFLGETTTLNAQLW